MIFLSILVILMAVASVIGLRARSVNPGMAREDFDLYALSARYRPMLRLLDGGDFELLSGTGDQRLLRRMRSQRRQIFRGYLRSLKRDHARVCACIRRLIVDGETDQSELVSRLYRMEIGFSFLLLCIEAQLTLHALGFGSVRVYRLIESLDQVRQQAEILTPSATLA